MQPRSSRAVVLLEAEPVPRLVADAAEDPRRVVDEREVVEDAQDACLEIGATAVRIDEAAEVVGAERRGHRVDREVAPEEVLAQARALDGRQRARRVVELRPRRDDVDALAVAVRHDRRPEPPMRRRASAEGLRERVRERDRVALDGDVDVEALLAEEDVADRAADEVDALRPIAEARDRVGDALQARARAKLVGDALRRLGRLRRGTPSSARSRSARLTTPTSSSSRRTATRPSSADVTSARSSASDASSATVATWLLMIPRTGACARSWPIALSRSSRLTPPTSRPPSATNTPLCPCRWQSVIASRTVESGATARAGVDMTSRASGRRARACPQRGDHALARGREALARDRRRGLRVAAAAERRGDGGRVDSLRPAPHDGEHALVHLDEHDERPRVREVDDLVREVRDAVDVLRPARSLRAAPRRPRSTGSSASSSACSSPRSAGASGACRYSLTRSWRAPWRRHHESASTSRCVVVAYVSEPVSSWIPSANAVASSGVGASSRSATIPTSVVVSAPSVDSTAASSDTQSGSSCSAWWSKRTFSTSGSSATARARRVATRSSPRRRSAGGSRRARAGSTSAIAPSSSACRR